MSTTDRENSRSSPYTQYPRGEQYNQNLRNAQNPGNGAYPYRRPAGGQQRPVRPPQPQIRTNPQTPNTPPYRAAAKKRPAVSAAGASVVIILLALLIFLVVFVWHFVARNAEPAATRSETETTPNAAAVTTRSPDEDAEIVETLHPIVAPPATGENAAIAPNPPSTGTYITLPATTAQPEPEKSKYGLVPESEAVGDDYFESALFIGDSRTVGVWLYSGLKSNFYAQQSLNVTTAQTKKFIKNNTQSLSEALAEDNSFKAVYVSFGINEFTYMSTAGYIKAFRALISIIREKLPDAAIYVEAVLPIAQWAIDKNDNYRNAGGNAKIADFNEHLLTMCEEDELYFVDLCEVFADENGSLVADSTDGVHFGVSDCKKWVEYLKTHTVTNG